MTEIISVGLGRVFSEYRKQSSLCELVCGMVVGMFLKFSSNNLWILSWTRHYDEGKREGAWWLWRESLWGNTGCCFLDFKQFRFTFEACLRSVVRWGRNRLQFWGTRAFRETYLCEICSWSSAGMKAKDLSHVYILAFVLLSIIILRSQRFTNCKIHLRNNGTPQLPIESFFLKKCKAFRLHVQNK